MQKFSTKGNWVFKINVWIEFGYRNNIEVLCTQVKRKEIVFTNG